MNKALARTRTSEGLLRACDDDSPDLLVGVDQAQGRLEFAEQRDVERIERFWAVERHECHAGLRARCENVLILCVECRYEPVGCKGKLVWWRENNTGRKLT